MARTDPQIQKQHSAPVSDSKDENEMFRNMLVENFNKRKIQKGLTVGERRTSGADQSNK